MENGKTSERKLENGNWKKREGHGRGNSKIEIRESERDTPSPHLFSELRILKELRGGVFATAHSKGLSYRSRPKFGGRSCHIPSALGQWRYSRFQRRSSAPLAMHQLLGITIRFCGRGRSRLGTIRPSRGFFQGFRMTGNRSIKHCNCRTPLAGRTRVVLDDPGRGERHCCPGFHCGYRLSAWSLVRT